MEIQKTRDSFESFERLNRVSVSTTKSLHKTHCRNIREQDEVKK